MVIIDQPRIAFPMLITYIAFFSPLKRRYRGCLGVFLKRLSKYFNQFVWPDPESAPNPLPVRTIGSTGLAIAARP
jgi:hypothetical protein